MIDASFIDKIQKLAEKCVAPVTVAGENGKKIIVVGGQVVATVDPDLGFGELVVSDFASFVDAVMSLNMTAEESILTVGRHSCTYVADLKQPNSRAVIRLHYRPTAAYAALMDWSSMKLGVKAVNSLLRTSLLGAFDESLLSVFRQVEFARSSATVVGKTVHRDTMGKTVDQAVKSSAGELPEFMRFTTPLFSNIPCASADLLCLVECDASNETITILPCGDCIDQVISATVRALIESLSKQLTDLLIVAADHEPK